MVVSRRDFGCTGGDYVGGSMLSFGDVTIGFVVMVKVTGLYFV